MYKRKYPLIYSKDPKEYPWDAEPRPEGCAWLPHSCDEWIIGGPEQIQELIEDLQEALKALTEVS